ncbi:MAG: hypothetical protein HYU66_10110 [Armatimonadetes bacterium]|nr:hypothetical protein [Armatimonadota bacterium]
MAIAIESTAGIDLTALAGLGEWAAVGFYEGLALPWPRCHGRALRRLYEHLPIRLDPDRLLIPNEPLPDARNFAAHGAWHAAALICDYNHHSGISLHPDIAEGKKAAYPEHAAAIDALVADLGPRIVHFGGYTHSNPDIRRVVTEGFLAMQAELSAAVADEQQHGSDPETFALLQALIDYAAGVRAYHGRLREALAAALPGRPELRPIAAAWERAFLHPAATFLEGLLAVHFTWTLDFCDSIGRFDQALGPLYEQDVANGTLDPSFARRLLDEVWQNFERFNGWNLQLGGWTPDGRDGCNALTLEGLEACRRNHLRRPNVAFRITAQTPDEAVARALDVLGCGSGRPALYNDDLYVKTLRGMDLGLTDEDAREIGFGGCTETMISGLSNVGSLEGELNLAKALELALHDGYDPVADRQSGPHTGEFAAMRSFDELLAAVKEQIRHATDAFCEHDRAALARRFHEGDPKLYRTFFTRDCVKRRKSFEAGGARYNWAVVCYQGITNLIDGLAAVRQVVFVDRAATPAELLAALDGDYAGAEPLRRRLSAAPRFGNDDDTVDQLGRELVEYAWQCLYRWPTPRGGRYLPSVILFATYADAGLRVAATPDGRKAFEPLVDSIGPVHGRDTHGPTAMLNSVTKLPLWLGAGTPVLNVRFQRSLFTEPGGLGRLTALLRSYFAAGGMQLQISVLDREALLAAQREPEKWADLIVRIGGYSEYFTRLGRSLQDTVIGRTEHGVG